MAVGSSPTRGTNVALTCGYVPQAERFSGHLPLYSPNSVMESSDFTPPFRLAALPLFNARTPTPRDSADFDLLDAVGLTRGGVGPPIVLHAVAKSRPRRCRRVRPRAPRAATACRDRISCAVSGQSRRIWLAVVRLRRRAACRAHLVQLVVSGQQFRECFLAGTQLPALRHRGQRFGKFAENSAETRFCIHVRGEPGPAFCWLEGESHGEVEEPLTDRTE